MKNKHAQALGKLGGRARALARGWENLSSEQRSAQARAAVTARWAKTTDRAAAAAKAWITRRKKKR